MNEEILTVVITELNLLVVITGLNLFAGSMNMKFYFDTKNKGNLFWGVANLVCFLVQFLVLMKKI
jgi:hypothetical protein